MLRAFGEVQRVINNALQTYCGVLQKQLWSQWPGPRPTPGALPLESEEHRQKGLRGKHTTD